MIRHRLPAPARSSGIPGEGVQAPLGTVKLPSIHRDAVIWKTEGVGPNSLSDCGFKVIWARSCHRLCGHRHFSAIGAPSESPSREVTQMKNMAQKQQCGCHMTIGGSHPTRLRLRWVQGG